MNLLVAAASLKRFSLSHTPGELDESCDNDESCECDDAKTSLASGGASCEGKISLASEPKIARGFTPTEYTWHKCTVGTLNRVPWTDITY